MHKPDAKVKFTTQDLNLVWMESSRALNLQWKDKIIYFEASREILSIYSDCGAWENIITN